MIPYLQGKPIQMTVNFPLETTETRKKWDSIFQLKRTVNPEIYIQQKHLSKMKGERRHFQVKKKKNPKTGTR